MELFPKYLSFEIPLTPTVVSQKLEKTIIECNGRRPMGAAIIIETSEKKDYFLISNMLMSQYNKGLHIEAKASQMYDFISFKKEGNALVADDKSIIMSGTVHSVRKYKSETRVDVVTRNGLIALIMSNESALTSDYLGKKIRFTGVLRHFLRDLCPESSLSVHTNTYQPYQLQSLIQDKSGGLRGIFANNERKISVYLDRCTLSPSSI